MPDPTVSGASTDFLSHFGGVDDPRQTAKITHPLNEIFLLVVCGVFGVIFSMLFREIAKMLWSSLTALSSRLTALPLAIVADKAYGSKAIRQAIADEGALAVIPSKSNAKVHIPHDPDLYAMRNLVERFFCKMKDMRRLTLRYEKMKRNYLGMVQLFAIRC